MQVYRYLNLDPDPFSTFYRETDTLTEVRYTQQDEEPFHPV
jgi:hypothetical protein